MPHTTWGEEVAAAVVAERSRSPRPSCSPTARSGWPTSSGPSRFTSPTPSRAPRPARFSARVVAQAFAHRGRSREDRHRRRRRDRRLHRRAAARGPARDVVLFARGPHLQAMQERGLRVTSAGRRLRGQAAGHRRSRDDRQGRRRLPRRQGARPDGARAAAAPAASVPTPSSSARRTASRGGTSRTTAASWTGCGSSASIRAASSPRRSSRGASSDRSPTLPTDVAEPGVIHHTEGNRISFGEPDGSKSERLRGDRRGADRRRLPLSGHRAVPPRDLGEAARQRRVQPDQRADRRHARGAGPPSGRVDASCARS